MNKSISDGKLSTIYFPLTANPVGYHHLLLAECSLWNFPETQLIVFLISNGIHPDNLKRVPIPEKLLRLEILKNAINDWPDPEKSLPAKIAIDEGIFLKLKKNNCTISRIEFSFNRPIRFSEHIQSFSGIETPAFLVGADLIKRMLNQNIFTNQDLEIIQQNSHLLIAPRNKIEIEKVLENLKKQRGISLKYSFVNTECLPENLKRFFSISSSIIRRAVQADQNLKYFLPMTASRILLQNSIYDKKFINFDKIYSNLDELNLRYNDLTIKLRIAAKMLIKLLNKLEGDKKLHRFSIIETCTGGNIASEFSSQVGASNHFLEARILYSKESQIQFLDRSVSYKSSISKKMAMDLAKTMCKNSGADWALSETGMAGPPSSERKSQKNGQCYLGLAFSSKVKYKYLEFNPFLTRKEHQLLIAIEALKWAKDILQIAE